MLVKRVAAFGGTTAMALGLLTGVAWAGTGSEDSGASCDNTNNSSVISEVFAGGGTSGGNGNCNFQDSDNGNGNFSGNIFSSQFG